MASLRSGDSSQLILIKQKMLTLCQSFLLGAANPDLKSGSSRGISSSLACRLVRSPWLPKTITGNFWVLKLRLTLLSQSYFNSTRSIPLPSKTRKKVSMTSMKTFFLERLRGIEPLSIPWQGIVLPLNHSRI